MNRESLFVASAAVVFVATVLAAALVPASLAQPAEDVRQSRLSIVDTTLTAGEVGGETATLGVTTYLRHAGGPAENVSVVYRAVDADTGLVATTVRRDVGEVTTDGEIAVTANLSVERQGGYRIDTLLYQGDRRIESGRTAVNGVGTLQPGYARSPVRFHRFESLGLPAVQYSIAEVRDNRTTLSVSTLLTNQGDTAAGGLSVVVTARQADSNIVADRAEVSVGNVEPGRTISPSTELSVPDGYNYYLDAVLYKDGVIVGASQSVANLDPTETISANQTRRSVGLSVEDFERSDTGDRRGPGNTGSPVEGGEPGFGLPAVLAAVAMLATLLLTRRWSP